MAKQSTTTNRRDALKSISAIGGLGLNSLKRTNLTPAGDTVKLVTARSGEEPIETEQVPADWWEYERKVTRVKERLAKRFNDRRMDAEPSQIDGISIGNSNEKISGYYKSKVRIYLDK